MNKGIKWLIAGAVTVALLSGYCIWQNEDLGVTHYTYTSNKIGEDLNGYKIVHISDLHNKEFGKNSSRLISLIEAEHPDMIVISGDMVDSRRTDIEAALRFVSQAVNIAPVYYATGNHEERLEADTLAYLLSSLEEIGATVLENESVTVYKNDESFVLFGLKDGTLEMLENIYSDTDKLKLMIAHRPQNLEAYNALGADLVFSGHAHGGQVRIPFVGGLIAPDQWFFPKYSEGMHSLDGVTVVISRGLGNSSVPVRVNNRPEVVVVTLEAENM